MNLDRQQILNLHQNIGVSDVCLLQKNSHSGRPRSNQCTWTITILVRFKLHETSCIYMYIQVESFESAITSWESHDSSTDTIFAGTFQNHVDVTSEDTQLLDDYCQKLRNELLYYLFKSPCLCWEKWEQVLGRWKQCVSMKMHLEQLCTVFFLLFTRLSCSSLAC